MPRLRIACAASVIAVASLLPTTAVLADPSAADRSRMATRSQSAFAAIPKPTAANLAAVQIIEGAETRIRVCIETSTNAGARNLGDLSETELTDLRRCIATELDSLAAKMQSLKAMARNAAFDYGAFAETVRLIVSTKDPIAAALQPMRSMLRQADAVAEDQSEKAVTLRLVEMVNDLTARLAPAPA